MRTLRTRILAAILGLTLITVPSIGHAAQISPNPNTGTIDIINDPFTVNNANPFTNAGTINIDSASTLNNAAGAFLVTQSQSTGATLNNAGTVNNYGGLSSDTRGNITNGGTVGFNFEGFSPVVGNSWKFLYANSLAGWGTLNVNFSGLTHEFFYANGAQTLKIVAVREPSSILLLASALGGLALCRRMKGYRRSIIGVLIIASRQARRADELALLRDPRHLVCEWRDQPGRLGRKLWA